MGEPQPDPATGFPGSKRRGGATIARQVIVQWRRES